MKNMKKINLSGITPESIVGIVLLMLALVNATLQMFGYNVLPIEDDTVSALVSGGFLLITSLYNSWKNRNITTAAQKTQTIMDALKTGALLVEQVDSLISQIKTGREDEGNGE